MGQLLLMMLGLVVVFVLVVLFVGRFVLNRMERSVARPHLEADFIMGTGLAPGRWTDGYNKVLARMERRGSSEKRRARYERTASRRVIRKLLRLQRNFERASIFSDEDSRRAMLGRIRFVVQQWRESPWAEIAPPGVGPGPGIEE